MPDHRGTRFGQGLYACAWLLDLFATTDPDTEERFVNRPCRLRSRTPDGHTTPLTTTPVSRHGPGVTHVRWLSSYEEMRLQE
jgi:hypothetical protein